MTDTPAPAAYPDPQDPGRTTLYELSSKTDALNGGQHGDTPTTPSERMAAELEEEE